MAAYEAWLSDAVLESPEFRTAQTHRSLGPPHYERQEFLGDALLGWVISEYLYAQFPDLAEGDLTRLRSYLVCRSMLSQLAHESGLGQTLRVDKQQALSQQSLRTIEGDALEAMITAVYQVEGMDSVRSFILDLYGEHLRQLPDPQSLINAKTLLQEYLAAQGIEPPDYTVVEEMPEQSPRFKVRCEAKDGEIQGYGMGDRIREAEKKAAAAAIEELQKQWPEWVQ